MKKLNMLGFLLTTTALVLSTNVYAIFCPSNFSNINYGDTISQVQEVCGKPTSQNTIKKPASLAQVWTYYMKQSNFTQNNTKLKFLIVDDKVVNISVVDSSPISVQKCHTTINPGAGPNLVETNCFKPNNSQENLTSTRLCGYIISTGDTAKKVELTCGKAALINQFQRNPAETPIELTELKYAGTPPVSLIFEDGKLRERKFS